MSKNTGISFIYSTTLYVCHNRRIHSHNIFVGIAQRGKPSTGWFYGCELHLVVNYKGKILSFAITPGNTDDRDLNLVDKLTNNITGKLFGYKGYISQKLFSYLFTNRLKLICKFLQTNNI